MASEKLDEAEKEAIESEQKYPKNGENFASQRLNILIEKSGRTVNESLCNRYRICRACCGCLSC